MASLSAPLNALRQRFSGRKGRGLASELDPCDPQAQLQQLGDRLRERRESLDLTMRQLALDTRVSTPVIEALEKAWSDRLPEAAFLRTIVDKLANRLDLDAAEIVAILQQNLPQQTNRFGRRHGPVTRFTLSSIELFNTWQGTIAYSLLVAGVLYGLNLQHRQLQSAQRQSLQPIPANPVKASEVGKQPEITANEQLLRLHPELLPLQQTPPSPLERLASNNEASSTAQPASGTLQLTLPEGVTPQEVGVQWNGAPLKADPAKPNTYSVPLWGAPEPRS